MPLPRFSEPPRRKPYNVELPVDAVDVLQREARRLQIPFRDLLSALVLAEAERIETTRSTMDCVKP
jgi:hypothetical protein